MLCSPTADSPQPQCGSRAFCSLSAICAILCLSFACLAANADFKVLEAKTLLTDGVHRVHADIAFDFSDEALEAMTNGVALTVAVEMQVLRITQVWDPQVATVKALYRIQSHALSRQYVVKDLSTGESTTYPNFAEMIAQIGHIDGLPLLDDYILDSSEQYRVRLRATLERESLPTPLRLLAYFSRSWRLSSDWTTWPLQR
ncbi:MAG: hypothetical protein ACI8W7_002679 [Gammaproteobacteria bacterium]|jgi:hypothetical protein